MIQVWALSIPKSLSIWSIAFWGHPHSGCWTMKSCKENHMWITWYHSEIISNISELKFSHGAILTGERCRGRCCCCRFCRPGKRQKRQQIGTFKPRVVLEENPWHVWNMFGTCMEHVWNMFGTYFICHAFRTLSSTVTFRNILYILRMPHHVDAPVKSVYVKFLPSLCLPCAFLVPSLCLPCALCFEELWFIWVSWRMRTAKSAKSARLRWAMGFVDHVGSQCEAPGRGLPQGASVASFGVLIFGSFMWWNTFAFLDLQKYEVRLSQKSEVKLLAATARLQNSCWPHSLSISWSKDAQYKFIKNSHFHICSHLFHIFREGTLQLFRCGSSLWCTPGPCGSRGDGSRFTVGYWKWFLNICVYRYMIYSIIYIYTHTICYLFI